MSSAPEAACKAEDAVKLESSSIPIRLASTKPHVSVSSELSPIHSPVSSTTPTTATSSIVPVAKDVKDVLLQEVGTVGSKSVTSLPDLSITTTISTSSLDETTSPAIAKSILPEDALKTDAAPTFKPMTSPAKPVEEDRHAAKSIARVAVPMVEAGGKGLGGPMIELEEGEVEEGGVVEVESVESVESLKGNISDGSSACDPAISLIEDCIASPVAKVDSASPVVGDASHGVGHAETLSKDIREDPSLVAKADSVGPVVDDPPAAVEDTDIGSKSIPYDGPCIKCYRPTRPHTTRECPFMYRRLPAAEQERRFAAKKLAAAAPGLPGLGMLENGSKELATTIRCFRCTGAGHEHPACPLDPQLDLPVEPPRTRNGPSHPGPPTAKPNNTKRWRLPAKSPSTRYVMGKMNMMTFDPPTFPRARSATGHVVAPTASSSHAAAAAWSTYTYPYAYPSGSSAGSSSTYGSSYFGGSTYGYYYGPPFS